LDSSVSSSALFPSLPSLFRRFLLSTFPSSTPFIPLTTPLFPLAGPHLPHGVPHRRRVGSLSFDPHHSRCYHFLRDHVRLLSSPSFLLLPPHLFLVTSVLYETCSDIAVPNRWSVDPFNAYRSQALNPTQPLVLANGDASGYGLHGDFFSTSPPLSSSSSSCSVDSDLILPLSSSLSLLASSL
jgi:hypothetical protein